MAPRRPRSDLRVRHVGPRQLPAARQSCSGARTSIYGPLAAPIAVLLWLYLTALVVLIGAALNAAFDQVWPESSTAGARLGAGTAAAPATR